eukprot:CCRYP_015351-RB/>CCRYP_015351-RB protein AED:0.33 eAED:0.33 QI:252/1/1/1/1/1/3/360/547
MTTTTITAARRYAMYHAGGFVPIQLPLVGQRYFAAALSTGKISSFEDSQFASDNTFPHPNDNNLFRYGMPLLARAAHNARMGRILAFDVHTANSDTQNQQNVVDSNKKIAYSYHEILLMSTHIHKALTAQKEHMSTTTNEKSIPYSSHEPPPRVAFLCHGPSYIATAFAAWSCGSIAVPLCISHRANELAYVLRDSDPTFIIDGTNVLSDGRELRLAAREAGLMDKYLCLEDVMADFHSLNIDKLQQSHPVSTDDYELGANGDIASMDSPAMIIYTSGTTGNPKGVVHTHKNIYYQITDLVKSWGWSHNDAILHFLPLHHVHGVINKLSCAIWSGASVEFIRFNPVKIWERLANKDDADKSLRREPTLFMGVPTIFSKMLEVLPKLPDTFDPSNAMSNIRLVVSGSAALPTSIFNRWKTLTGHTILERYGMTEFAMALSNPLTPIEKRLPGFVGMPLPSVEVKIIDEDTAETISSFDRINGQTSKAASDGALKRGCGDQPYSLSIGENHMLLLSLLTLKDTSKQEMLLNTIRIRNLIISLVVCQRIL